MKQSGFTLFELLFVVVALTLIMTTIYAFSKQSESDVTFGINGFVENRCINGMQFIIDQRGRATQVMDEHGQGLKCS